MIFVHDNLRREMENTIGKHKIKITKELKFIWSSLPFGFNCSIWTPDFINKMTSRMTTATAILAINEQGQLLKTARKKPAIEPMAAKDQTATQMPKSILIRAMMVMPKGLLFILVIWCAGRRPTKVKSYRACRA